jgi:RNA polymerase sigma-70 factor (ECF subfamily)
MADVTTGQMQVWIDQMNAGDAAARDRLVGQVCSRLERVSRKIRKDFPRLRAKEETGDLSQKGMVRLLRALKEVKVGNVKEFFRLAALQVRRELLDQARRPDRVKNAGDVDPASLHEAVDPASDPTHLAGWTEFHAKVEALPAQEREVFDLLWYQGLSQAEAAEILAVSVPTVKRRWLSARLRMQTVVDMDEFE